MKENVRFLFPLCTIAALAYAAPVRATLADYQTAVSNETSIISYYTFDRTNANDGLGLHDGTLQGTTSFTAGIGSAGRGLAVNGSGRVNLGTVSDFDFTDGTGSVEAWVRPGWTGTFSAYNPCIFADRNGGPVTWSVHMNGDKSGVGVWNGSSYLPLPIPPPGTNWHHLVVTFDNSSTIGLVEVFWDGVSLGTRTQDVGLGGNPTQLGSSQASVTDEGWIGSLDEVAFYANALSAAQVQAHYQALFAGTPPVITRQPRGGTYLPGVDLQLSVGATGPNLSYQWYKGTSSLPGATDSALTLSGLSAGNADTYHVVVSNPGATVPSSNAVVTLGAAISPNLAANQAAVSNESSLISYYSIDRLTIHDAKGLHDGALQGTAYFGGGVAGGPDQGLLLDGAGQATFGPVSDFDFSDGTGSVEAWVRADWDSIGYNPCLFADRDGGIVNWSIHMNADKRALGMWNGTAYQTFGFPDAGTNWHHVVVEFDTGNLTVYWDGVLLGTMAQALGGNPASIQLGSTAAASAAESWVGVIDEVAFYADPLPAANVQAHYRALLNNAPPVITAQPVGGAFYPGRPLELSAWASGADLTYQWYKDGSPVPGGTNWFLDFAPLATSDAGSYYVKISNPGFFAISSTAVVQTGAKLTSYQAAVRAEPSLISYYTFDAGDATDSKGTNTGTAIGTASFDTGVGLTDKALLLDGAGSVNLGLVP
ncbi:MAG TPA: LamG-like jellyroll fold domain-containing protein, partial [Verrucomicrobiae bacterium]|nr:LamG-like jellyroll fold domain-containing protein [Verrucomicrobiae bacterium]